MFKKYNLKYFLFFIFSLIFITLITGPALPDIFLVFFIILSLFFYNQEIYEVIKSRIFIFCLFYWIWLIFISFFAYDFESSLIEALLFARFILFILICYLIFSNINLKVIKYALNLIFVCCIFVAIDTMYQFYNYSDEYGFGYDLIGRKPDGLYGRLSGPFSDLVPGSYLSRLIFFVFLIYVINIKKIKRELLLNYLIIFFITVILSAIYFSGERMALATTILGLSVLFIFESKLRILISQTIVLTVIFIIINLIYHPHYKNFKIISSTSMHEGLIIEKYYNCSSKKMCKKLFKAQPKFIEIIKDFKFSAYGQIYLSSLHMWNDNKLTGIGLNNFNYVCTNKDKYRRYNKYFGCTTHPHNIYLQSLLETGLIGFIMFVLIIFIFFSKVLRSKFTPAKYSLICILLTIFWPIMSTGSFLKNWNMVFISVLISLCIIISNLDFNRKKLDKEN